MAAKVIAVLAPMVGIAAAAIYSRHPCPCHVFPFPPKLSMYSHPPVSLYALCLRLLLSLGSFSCLNTGSLSLSFHISYLFSDFNTCLFFVCLHCEVCIGSVGTVQVLCKPEDVVRVEELVCLMVRWMDG